MMKGLSSKGSKIAVAALGLFAVLLLTQSREQGDVQRFITTRPTPAPRTQTDPPVIDVTSHAEAVNPPAAGEGKPDPKPDSKPDPKPDPKPEQKAEEKAEEKQQADDKPSPKPSDDGDGPPLAELRAKVTGDTCMAEQLRWSYTEVEVKGHMRRVLPPTMHGDHAVEPFMKQVNEELGSAVCAQGGEFEAPAVVDVGANIGQGLGMWLKLARCNKSLVMAFEGQYATWKVLRGTARDLGRRMRFNVSGPSARILAINRAIGERNARVTFWDNYGEGRVGNRAEIFAQKGGGRVKWTPYNSQHSSLTPLTKFAKAMKVKMVKLDNAIPGLLGSRRLLLLKTDAEGHDLPALRGARKLLKSGRADVVMFEYNRRLWIKSGNYTLGQARRYLAEHGFAVYLLAEKILSLDPPQNPDAWDDDGREKMIMTGLGLRTGSTVACKLLASGWLRTQAAHSKCERELEVPLEAGCK